MIKEKKSRPLPFFLVDVFAEREYSGNQLAVFHHTGRLSSARMQRIAREMNFSETTFVLPAPAKGGCDVRIFTPAREVPFAGHPVLGTAFVIREFLAKGSPNGIVLNVKAGKIPVTFTLKNGRPDLLWMRQNAPVFGKTIESAALAGTLGLSPGDMEDSLPVEEVSTGLPFLIAPLASLDAVRRARVNPGFDELVAPLSAKAVLIFTRETYGKANDLNARMFGGHYGVPEDPATGSANGCLAAYLVRHGALGERRTLVRVEQGYEIGRPSLLYLKAWPEGDAITVNVGGRVRLVARGEFV